MRDKDRDGQGRVDALCGEQGLGLEQMLWRRKYLGFDQAGIGGEREGQRCAMAERVEDAEVVGDLAEAWVEMKRRSAEALQDGEADAGVGPAEQSGEGEARTLVAEGLEKGVGLVVEELRGTEGFDGSGKIAQGAGRGYEPLETGIVAEDVQGEAAGDGSDACSRNGGVESGNQWGRMDRRAQSLGMLKQDKVANS